ncbi:MAG TPA: hypothetical protein VMX17_16015 [Candidatus Glassbacteria bacterium]|nr:hypothetical protein [Candidatus Glassbacteria bacterium]
MLYCNRCTLEMNGVSFSDFSSFTDNSVIKAKAVNMMHKTGHAKMTPRYGFTIEIKKPYLGSIDLDEVEEGTLTVEYDSGERILYRGVYTLETGDSSMDGETELTITKSFSASEKKKEN